MNMENKDQVIYIQVPASEPPEKGGHYGIVLKDGKVDSDEYYSDIKKWGFWNSKAVTYWLKPVPLSKYANDFAEWLTKTFTRSGDRWRQKSWREHENFGFQFYTTSELQQEFLKTYKG